MHRKSEFKIGKIDKVYGNEKNEQNILLDENWQNEVLNIIDYVGEENDVIQSLDDKSRTHMFIEFVKPIISWAIERDMEAAEIINGDKKYETVFHRAVMQSCFNIIIQNALKVLIVELREYGSVYPEREPEFNYKMFSGLLSDKEFYAGLLKKYPVMTRTVIEQCKMCIFYLKEVKMHYIKDYPMLQENFTVSGSLEEIEMNQGDTHCKKKSVIILKFENGKVVYKPKSMEINLRFNEILDYLNKKGLKYSVQKPMIQTESGYGWQEYIEYRQCRSYSEVQELYYKYGVYAALFYIFAGSDMHMENVVVREKEPFFIDLESLFQGYQGVPMQGESSFEEIVQEIRDSVLSTCLFPAHISNQSGYDVSGITGHGGQAVPRGRYELINRCRSDVMLVRTTYITEDKKNIGMLDHKRVNPRDFVNDIVEGFTSVYEIIRHNKSDFISKGGLLYRFKDIPIRTIVRNTKQYSTLLKASTDPENLTDFSIQEKLFERLRITLKDNPKLSGIIPSEIKDLRNGDIPYFSSELFTSDIVDSMGKRHVNFMDIPVSSLVIEKIESLSEEKRDWQIRYIRQALAKPIKRWELKSKKIDYSIMQPVESNTATVISEAKHIESMIRTAAYIHESGEDMNWIDISISSASQWYIHPMDSSLYDGVLGPALFYAALYHITGENEYLHFLKMSMRSSEKYLSRYSVKESLSAFSGYASMAYVYYYVGTVTKQDFYKRESVSLIKKCAEQIRTDKMLDIVGGCAGTLIVSLRIYEKNGGPELLDMAVSCGEKLIEEAIELPKGLGWKTAIGGGGCLAGMSHGCAGMAWALLELYKHTNDNRYKDYAQRAIVYENSLYVKEDNNWMDMRNRENRVKRGFPEPVHWCHGAAGIGISRAMCYAIMPESGLKQDTQNAIQKTLEAGFGGSDCLCHGSMGSIDLLLTASIIFENNDYRIMAEKISYDLIQRARQDQWYSGVPQKFNSMGLMVGLSGIGYELLRVYSPAKIPSVLTLELPEE